jgi:hypothetical protein
VRVFLRVAASVVLGWSTGYVLAGQRAPDPYEALRDGKLTFWVSSRWTFDGEGLVARQTLSCLLSRQRGKMGLYPMLSSRTTLHRNAR